MYERQMLPLTTPIDMTDLRAPSRQATGSCDTASTGGPDRFDLKTGFACNNRCRFCVQGDKRNTEPVLRTPEAEARLREGARHTRALVLTGGEVTLRKDLCHLIGYARSLGFTHIQIQTNGRMFAYPRFCDEVIAAGATEFAPSLHGPDAATHDAQTGAPGSFDQTVQGIGNLRARGQRVITNTVVTSTNYRELARVAELLARLGVSQMQFAFPHPLGSAAKNFADVVPRLNDAMPHVREALARAARAGILAFTEAVPYCHLHGHEKAAAEATMPRTRIRDGRHEIADYTAYRWNEGKAKGPACPECSFNSVCEGVWREYAETCGTADLVARHDAVPDVLACEPGPARAMEI